MKKLIPFFLSLLMALWTHHGSAASADDLHVDSLHVYGNHMVSMVQRIEFGVTNLTTESYEGRWHVIAVNSETGVTTHCLDTLVTMEGVTTSIYRFYCALPQGPQVLMVATDAEGQRPLTAVDVVITPLRPLQFDATLTLDAALADGVLYGNRIRGTVSVRNDDASYYGMNGGKTDDDGLFVWLEEAATGTVLQRQHIASQLDYSLGVSAAFDFMPVFRDGGQYLLKVGYAVPDGMVTFQSLSITTRSAANSYWTADGQVLPLPVSDGCLLVPAEAVAVDLRGQQAVGALHPIETSQANPNCLYYLDTLGSLPVGLDYSRNVIRGDEAQRVRLTEGYDYFCPMAFTAHLISYMMTPSYDNPDDAMRARGYSETLVLPFNVSDACLYDVNDGSEILHADMLQVLEYRGVFGDTLNVSKLSTVRQMAAYVPYVLGVYVGSKLLFFGEDTRVPVTREAVVRGPGAAFIGTTVACVPQASAFLYDAQEACFYPSQARVAPFHGYLDVEKAASDVSPSVLLSISDASWGDKGNPTHSTAISSVERDLVPAASRVYDVYGRPWHLTVGDMRRLPKGIYVVGGRKIIIR